MENPFSVLEKRLSDLEGLMLELINRIHLTGAGHLEEKPINIEGASEFLNIPVNTIYSLTSKRGIYCHKKGKHLFFYQSELNQWVKEGRLKTVAQIRSEAIKGMRNG